MCHYPVVHILYIFSILGSIYLWKGTNIEVREETFLPDSKLVQAQIEINEKYTTTKTIQILVKASKTSNHTNLLTPEALTEILRTEKVLLECSRVNATLITETNPQRVFSVVDSIIQWYYGIEHTL